MRWVVLALALVGCGEASPVGMLGELDNDAGADGAASKIAGSGLPPYPLCQGLETQAPYTSYGPCVPGWTIADSITWTMADGGTTSGSAVEYAYCGVATTPCALPPQYIVQSIGNGRFNYTLHVYCVPVVSSDDLSCPDYANGPPSP